MLRQCGVQLARHAGHLTGIWTSTRLPRKSTKRRGSKVNRSIQKPPGQGEMEFLHFDFNPFAEMRRALDNVDSSDPQIHAMCGKTVQTPLRFM